ncbi:ABC transporter substrate-binding protein [Aurantibacter crassamenti]|uniref:ABC transporter substrate-binding protein n=1 Tax=Aurantibacter crassamenti TaxID=1837375 RepID=UPI001EEDC812|nr:ABC transporter substrate-binding protein [Aurantibacter crassamenti]
MRNLLLLFALLLLSCKSENKKSEQSIELPKVEQIAVKYANGFSIEKSGDITILSISSPWPNSESAFTYALIPKAKMAAMTLNVDAYDAIIGTPVDNIVVTSTTHIPALEALGVLDKLRGFPDTQYISSVKTRKLIADGKIKELGSNHSLNTEMVIELKPEVVIGFSISSENKAYETLSHAKILVVYNGDWTEQTPLGKAEWIKFFAPFFELDDKANSLFNEIESSYLAVKELAKKAKTKPTVLSGALYKDVWYLPGGGSWAAQFIEDANADYLYKETTETGSLSLGIEAILTKAKNAEFWISPSQFTAYNEMEKAGRHYSQFDAFQSKNLYTFAKTKGETDGLLYFELAPNRPDLVLKDLVHIFHPDLLPNHNPFFFKPLD